MFRTRSFSGQIPTSLSVEHILRQADCAQCNGRPDEVSSLLDIVYAILEGEGECLH